MATIPPNPEEALVTISSEKPDRMLIRDRVDSSRFEFYFDDDAELESASDMGLHFPVDVSARIAGAWSMISAPMATGVFVHEHETGEVVDKIAQARPSMELESGRYELEINPAPVKIYILVEAPVSLQINEGEIQITRHHTEPVIMGIRSPHEHPAGTIRTTADIDDLMLAVSQLGSALKTTTVERSWPTLRGQPPNIELADEVEIPPTIRRHDVDVQIEIPRDRTALFNVASLAYYTSARVVPLSDETDHPAIVAAGRRFPLTDDLGSSAGDQLKRNVLLDSAVRSVGIYNIQTAEYEHIRDNTAWNFEEVYELPLGERIAAYQQVPNTVLDDIWPKWPLTVDVSASLDDIPAIPHIAEELAYVRVPKAHHATPSPEPTYVSEFIRTDGSGASSVERTTGQTQPDRDVNTPLAWQTQLHTSLEPGYPLGSNKTSIRAYERHLEREAPQENAIEVKVVCNDDEMREEDVVSEFYGLRDMLEFDISSHYNLTTAEFVELLAGSYDLIHYIGHVDDAGFKCSDGYVDARTDIGDVNFDVFLLNACRSVEQAEALLDAGAEGGIATLYDIPNSSATKVGRTLSRLLNRGFTIRSAMEIARESSVLGNRWVSLGNGRVSLTQSESGVTFVSTATPRADHFEFEVECFETASHRIGTIIDLNTEWAEPCVLPGRIERTLSEEELEEFFSLEVTPVRCENDLYWTDEVSPGELNELQE